MHDPVVGDRAAQPGGVGGAEQGSPPGASVAADPVVRLDDQRVPGQPLAHRWQSSVPDPLGKRGCLLALPPRRTGAVAVAGTGREEAATGQERCGRHGSGQPEELLAGHVPTHRDPPPGWVLERTHAGHDRSRRHNDPKFQMAENRFHAGRYDHAKPVSTDVRRMRGLAPIPVTGDEKRDACAQPWQGLRGRSGAADTAALACTDGAGVTDRRPQPGLLCLAVTAARTASDKPSSGTLPSMRTPLT